MIRDDHITLYSALELLQTGLLDKREACHYLEIGAVINTLAEHPDMSILM